MRPATYQAYKFKIIKIQYWLKNRKIDQQNKIGTSEKKKTQVYEKISLLRGNTKIM